MNPNIDRAYDRGNYAAAYEGESCTALLDASGLQDPQERAAFVLGFFSSYEMDEIHGEEHELMAQIQEDYPDLWSAFRDEE